MDHSQIIGMNLEVLSKALNLGYVFGNLQIEQCVTKIREIAEVSK